MLRATLKLCSLSTLAISAAVFAIPAIAHGSAVADGDPIAVDYSDLDLSSATDRQELDRRVDRAARKVCEYDPRIRDTTQKREQRQCLEVAVASTFEQIAAAEKRNAEGPVLAGFGGN